MNKTIPDRHLFIVRGRPVMFRKDKEFCGALHATERGYSALPPRPEGEPVIPIPPQTLELDFGDSAPR